MSTEQHPVLQDKITVEYNKQTYVFRIPSPIEWGRVGIRARDLRREGGIESGDEDGLDFQTVMTFRGAAIFEMLLEKTSADWPFSEDEEGKPIVDSNKFPVSATLDLLEVTQRFNESLLGFFGSGTGDGEPASPENLEGEPNTGV